MQTVPVQALPNQTMQIVLGSQSVTLNVYQLSTGLFMDVLVGSNLIIGGVICENLNRIVRDLYLGFAGDLIWFDTQGTSDPIYSGLGARWLLIYLSTSDLPAGVG